MHDEFPNLVREDRMRHIPEVLPLALASFRIGVRKIRLHLVVLKQLGVHGLDGDFVVFSELYVLDLLLSKQMLPPSDDGFHVILNDMILGEDVELL